MITRNYNDEPCFECTEDALNYALDIFDNPEEMKRLSIFRGQYMARFELEKKFGYPNPNYASQIATTIQFFNECLSECDFINRCCIRAKQQ